MQSTITIINPVLVGIESALFLDAESWFVMLLNHLELF